MLRPASASPPPPTCSPRPCAPPPRSRPASRQASGFALPDGLLERITGIRERRVVVEGEEFASTLAIDAGRRALARAGRDAEEVDLLLFASASRDFVEPATAHVVQPRARHAAPTAST